MTWTYIVLAGTYNDAEEHFYINGGNRLGTCFAVDLQPAIGQPREVARGIIMKYGRLEKPWSMSQILGLVECLIFVHPDETTGIVDYVECGVECTFAETK